MKRKVILLVAFTVLLLANIAICLLSAQRQTALPTVCHYQLKHIRNSDQGIIIINAVYTFLLNSGQRGEFSVEGQVTGPEMSFHMNRVMKFNVHREKQSGIYMLEFYATERKQDDTTPDKVFNQHHASLTSRILLKVDKVKDNAYLLTSQVTPLPVCLVY